MLPTSAGPLLTGGSDAAIRLWDADLPESSYVVCGAPFAPLAPSALPRSGRAPPPSLRPLKYTFSQRSMQGVPVIQETCSAREPDVGRRPEEVGFSLGFTV